MIYNDHKVCIAGGYPAIWIDGKLVRIHILEMEKHLGRPLKSTECVHHKDENKMNYDINNLICFRSNADHSAYHKGVPIEFDDDGIAYCPTKGIRKRANSKTVYVACPICGKLRSATATMCLDCYNKNRKQSSKNHQKRNLKLILIPYII